MAEAASLEIKVTSTGAETAAAHLRVLASMADRAGVSVEEMQKRVNKTSKNFQDASKPAAELGNALGGKGGGGAPPLSDAADKGSSALDRLANTLTRRLIFGAIILQARHAVTALFEIPSALAAVADAVDRTRISARSLQELGSLAGFKGIAGPEFLAGVNAFANKLGESKDVTTDLGVLFRLNKQTLGDTGDTLAKVADLVRNAASEQTKINILTAANLPTTIAWRKLMEQGGEEIRRILKEQGLSNVASDEAVRRAKEFDEAWNRAWTNFKSYAVGATGAALGAIELLIDKGRQGLISAGAITAAQIGKNMIIAGQGTRGDFSQFGGLDRQIAGRAGSPGTTIDPEIERKNLAITQQRLGLLSGILSIDQQVLQTTLGINAAGLNGISITAQQKKLLEDITRTQAEGARISERSAFGLGTSKDLQLQAIRELDIATRRWNLSTAEQATAQVALAKRMEDTSRQIQITAAQLPGLMRLQVEAGDLRVQLDQLGQSMTTGITNPLLDMATGTKSASDAFKEMSANIIKSILNMIIQMQIAMPIAKALQGLLGGFLPGAAAVDPWAGMRVASAKGNVFMGGNVVPYARGGVINQPILFPMAKGLGLAGEAGPEAIMPLRRGKDGRLGVEMNGGAGGTPQINFTSVVHNNAPVEVEQRMSGDGMTLETIIRPMKEDIAGDIMAGRGPISKALKAVDSKRNLRG